MGQPIHVVGIGGTLRQESRSLWAMDHTLRIAKAEGAKITRFNLRELNLPMFDPSQDFEDLSPKIQDYINTMRAADAMIWTTGAYHGTLAGVTKNAIDYMDYMRGGVSPFLHNKVVGLIATAGGDMAGINSLAAMTHSVHSLRGIVAPLMVSIHGAKNEFDSDGNVTSSKYEKKLTGLAELVVELAQRHRIARYAVSS